MLEYVIGSAEGKGQFRWIDIVDPDREELEKVSAEFDLHTTSVQDCLDPHHLPKYEVFENVTFLITRAFDEHSSPDNDTIQSLTRKIALFLGDNFLITVHRSDQPFLSQIKKKWTSPQKPIPKSCSVIVWDILRTVAQTYDAPINAAALLVEGSEAEVFTKSRQRPGLIEDLYYLRRRAAVFRKMLRMSIEIISQFDHFDEDDAPLYQDVRERTQRVYFYAEELTENVNNLLNHFISLSSYRTNEIMRVLTLFSVFFLPLTFVAGIYGMNFEYMPEFRMKYGYPAVMSVMFGISLGIYLWFRNKGWVK